MWEDYLADIWRRYNREVGAYKHIEKPSDRTDAYTSIRSLGRAVGLSDPDICAKIGKPYDAMAEALLDAELAGTLTSEEATRIVAELAPHLMGAATLPGQSPTSKSDRSPSPSAIIPPSLAAARAMIARSRKLKSPVE